MTNNIISENINIPFLEPDRHGLRENARGGGKHVTFSVSVASHSSTPSTGHCIDCLTL